MDKNTITVIIVVLAVLIGLPILANLISQDRQATANQAQPAAQGAESAASVPKEPPYWNAANLAGTVWTGKFSGVQATLTLNAGGTALATSDSILVKSLVPSGQLQGTWSVEGDKFTVNADIPKMGTKSMKGVISGKQFLDNKGVPLPLTQVK
jgi:hypothetical protein